jgi:RNA polymerase sigma-70 factor (ECF subfamily)
MPESAAKVPKIANRGEETIEAIVAEHETALLRYATRLLNNPAGAQDIVQEAFLKLFKNWRTGLRPTEKISAWLYRVTHNFAVDYIRRESRLNLLHNRHAAEQPDPPAVFGSSQMESESYQFVLAEIGKLDLDERQVAVLRFQEGLSYREISAITGRTEGNVGCILHKVVKQLAAKFKQTGII